MSALPTVEQLAGIVGLPFDAQELVQTLRGLGELTRPEVGEESAYIEYEAAGIQVVLQEESFIRSAHGGFRPEGKFVVVAVHLYAKGLEGYEEYGGQLPNQLRFGDSGEVANGKLGVPDAKGGGNVGAGRKWPKWDRYDYERYSLRLQYDAQGKLEQVTLFRP